MMGVFGEFNAWLASVLSSYISQNTLALARILEPVIVTLGIFYVMVWGYLHLTGKIEQPFLEGAKRLITLGVIFGMALQLWAYNDLFVDTFFNAPTKLAGAMIAARNPSGPEFEPVAVVDEILADGHDAASLLMAKGEIFGRDIVFYMASGTIYVVVLITSVYTMFLLALSRIALAVLLAMGPIFLVFLLFETSKKFFEAWLAQLCNYAFLAILTVLVAGLMLEVMTTAAQSAVAAGGGITIAKALQVCAVGLLTFLIMLQAPSMAQGLASGIALSSLGAMGGLTRMVGGVFGFGWRKGKDFSRGALIDKDSSRWDSLSRKAGQQIGLRMSREKRPRVNTINHR
jgi:type IV secretion system protein VirB6